MRHTAHECGQKQCNSVFFLLSCAVGDAHVAGLQQLTIRCPAGGIDCVGPENVFEHKEILSHLLQWDRAAKVPRPLPSIRDGGPAVMAWITVVTIAAMVDVQALLIDHLGINK